mmetsp:Transcript_46418/g.83814  ORF Transcript_46418/g.83814 Transcript_46418/m.83814 type:complete len:280 (-) Transcript_46418:1440-2279(-)
MLEGGGPSGQNHELLTRKPISSMAATIDHVERWYWHHKFVCRLSRKLCHILVQWHFICSGSCSANSHGDSKNCICAQVGFAPAPLVLCTIELLDHQLVNCGLIGHIHANQLWSNDLVDVRNGFQDSLAQETRLVGVSQFQGLIDASRSSTRYCSTKQRYLRAEIDFNCWVSSGIKDLSRSQQADLGAAGTGCAWDRRRCQHRRKQFLCWNLEPGSVTSAFAGLRKVLPNFHSEDFPQLDAPLVEGVDAPNPALHSCAMLVHGQQNTKVVGITNWHQDRA